MTGKEFKDREERIDTLFKMKRNKAEYVKTKLMIELYEEDINDLIKEFIEVYNHEINEKNGVIHEDDPNRTLVEVANDIATQSESLRDTKQKLNRLEKEYANYRAILSLEEDIED